MSQYWVFTASFSVLLAATRALPFMMANLLSPRMIKVGQRLPAFIMMLLVVYNADLHLMFQLYHALHVSAALSVVTLVHLRFRHTLLSIFSGTVIYVFLLNFWT